MRFRPCQEGKKTYGPQRTTFSFSFCFGFSSDLFVLTSPECFLFSSPLRLLSFRWDSIRLSDYTVFLVPHFSFKNPVKCPLCPFFLHLLHEEVRMLPPQVHKRNTTNTRTKTTSWATRCATPRNSIGRVQVVPRKQRPLRKQQPEKTLPSFFKFLWPFQVAQHFLNENFISALEGPRASPWFAFHLDVCQ